MKKRFFAVFLALALSMGLSVPAFASQTSPTGEEMMRNVTLSFEAGGKTFYPIKAGDFEIDRENPYQVETDMKVLKDDGSTASITKYVAIPSNALFTVSHTGKTDSESYIQVYARVYINNGKGTYEPEWVEDMVLAQDGFFHDASLSQFFPPATLTAGQSIQFPMPVTLHSDDYICTLDVHVYYPKTMRASRTNGYIYKVDDNAVKAYLADEGDTPSFVDVPAGAYFTQSVMWAVDKGITNGTSDTTFSPNQDCTHAHILTFLWRATGAPDPSIEYPFDVADVYTDALNWAYENRMVSTNWSPNEPCSRAQAVTFIWQALGKPTPKQATSFTDVHPNSYCADAVSWAVENGITNGTSGTTFSPNDVCNRSQIVTFLHRAYVEEARLPAVK